MDELFDKIKGGASKTKDTAGKWAKVFAKHTSNAITSTKLSYSINDAKNQITDIYTEIGKTIYEKYKNGEYSNLEFESEFERIDALITDIDELRDKKAELKNVLRCEECGTMNPQSSEYCSKCGAKLTDSNELEIDDDTADDDDVITITPVQGE